MSVTKQQIQHIAKLAKLDLSESEITKYEKEFNSILNYISKLNEVDIEGIGYEHNLENHSGKVLKKDVVKPSNISRQKMLLNATQGRTKMGYIVTSKIVNKE